MRTIDPNDPETHRQIAWAYAASNRPARMKPHVDFLLHADWEELVSAAGVPEALIAFDRARWGGEGESE